MKRAVVTGHLGQDGYYLTCLLESRGYEVITTDQRLELPIVQRGLLAWQPDEYYMLAARQNIPESFAEPLAYFDANTRPIIATLDLARAISPTTRFFYPSTCETLEPTFTSPSGGFCYGARSPYAASKLAAQTCAAAMRSTGLYVAIGLMFNHESPRRRAHFVLQKLARGLVGFAHGGAPVVIENLAIERDWHHAADAVAGMHLALQQPTGEDYVFASGETHSVEEAARFMCGRLAIDFDEAVRGGRDTRDFDRTRRRLGDPRKLESLGWARAHSFIDILSEMLTAAIAPKEPAACESRS